MPSPAKPAPVSGPGQLARRTDSGPAQKMRELPDAQYGEAQTFRGLQEAAPLAQTPDPTKLAGNASGQPTGVTPSVIPLNAPTTRPDEPVTTGSKFGPGGGPEVLGPAATPSEAQYQSAKTVLQGVAASSGNSDAAALLSMLQTRL